MHCGADARVEVSCRGCALSRICLPARLSPPETRLLEQAVERGRPLAAGASLIHAGRRLQALYVVRGGSAKSIGLSIEGDEQILGFHLPGEVVGLEAFARDLHLCEVVALEPMRFCRIPVRRLEPLMQALPGLRREIIRLRGQSLQEAQRQRSCMGLADARQRLAGFLVDLSRRLEQRGLSARQLRLSMSRRDIANHLALTLETVSRTLSAFKRAGWLAVRLRQIEILQPQALAALSGAA